MALQCRDMAPQGLLGRVKGRVHGSGPTLDDGRRQSPLEVVALDLDGIEQPALDPQR